MNQCDETANFYRKCAQAAKESSIRLRVYIGFFVGMLALVGCGLLLREIVKIGIVSWSPVALSVACLVLVGWRSVASVKDDSPDKTLLFRVIGVLKKEFLALFRVCFSLVCVLPILGLISYSIDHSNESSKQQSNDPAVVRMYGWPCVHFKGCDARISGSGYHYPFYGTRHLVGLVANLAFIASVVLVAGWGLYKLLDIGAFRLYEIILAQLFVSCMLAALWSGNQIELPISFDRVETKWPDAPYTYTGRLYDSISDANSVGGI